MAIEIEENPIATAVSQAIGSIPSYIQAGQNYKTNQLNNQVTMLNAVMSANQYQRDEKDYRKTNFMDALGYENPIINELIQGWQYPLGKFEKNAANPSGWGWTDEDMANVLPTKGEAWEQYKKSLGGYYNQQDHDLFFKQLWPSVVQSRKTSYESEISRLVNMGVSPRDIKWIMANNPIFDKGLANLQGSLTPAEQTDFKPFIAQEDKTLGERWQESGPILGGATLGAAGLGGYIMAPNLKVQKESREAYQARADEWKNKIDTKKKDLEKLKKRKASTKASKKAKKTRIEKLKKSLNKTRRKRTIDLKKLNKTLMQDVKDTRLWNKLKMGTNPAWRLGAAAVAPYLFRKAGSMVAGDRGEAVGAGLGGATQLASAGVSGANIYRKIAQMFAKNTVKRGATAGIMALSDSPISPIMDIAGLGYMGYGGVQDILEAYRMWQEDKLRRKNR